MRGSIPFTRDAGYRLFLPDGDPPAAGHPLVLALHGYSLDAEILLRRMRALTSGPYALLVPDGPYPMVVREAKPPRVGYSWYQFTGDQDEFLREMETTIAHLERLLEKVCSEHPVDRQRVALVGYSQGGYLAGYMGLLRPECYRAVVTISSRIKVEALAESLPRATDLPVLVIHGRGDGVVLLEPQQEAIAELRRHGVAVELELHDGGHGLRRGDDQIVDAFLRRVLLDPESEGPDQASG